MGNCNNVTLIWIESNIRHKRSQTLDSMVYEKVGRAIPDPWNSRGRASKHVKIVDLD